MKRLLTALLTATLLVFTTGCEIIPQDNAEAPVRSEEVVEAVTVAITTENGANEVATETINISEGQTVMDVLLGAFDVEEDNGFITSINGIKAEDGEEKAWFYEVNGEAAMVGASDYELSDGDEVAFNFHAW